MAFFPGNRSSGTKKPSASERFKQQMSGNKQKELTPEQKYKQIFEAKMQKMMEDAIMGRKKAPRLPGTKAPDDQEPPPLSKNAKLMLQMLAIQKMKKDQKQEKKRLREEMWAENAKKRSAALNKSIKDAQAENARLEQVAAEANAAAAATAPSNYSFGSTYGDDKSGW